LKPVVEQLFADPELVSRQLLDDLLKYKRLDGVSEALRALGAAQFGGGRQAEQPCHRRKDRVLVLALGPDSADARFRGRPGWPCATATDRRRLGCTLNPACRV
jgi:hypothetical protein